MKKHVALVFFFFLFLTPPKGCYNRPAEPTPIYNDKKPKEYMPPFTPKAQDPAKEPGEPKEQNSLHDIPQGQVDL